MEDNDDKLVELVILPMKTFGASEVERLSNAIGERVSTMHHYLLCTFVCRFFCFCFATHILLIEAGHILFHSDISTNNICHGITLVIVNSFMRSYEKITSTSEWQKHPFANNQRIGPSFIARVIETLRVGIVSPSTNTH